jgi:hypothetical protein
MPFRFTAAQRDQALFLEPLKDGPVFRELEPALTAPLEMLDQSLTDILVDFLVGGFCDSFSGSVSSAEWPSHPPSGPPRFLD